MPNTFLREADPSQDEALPWPVVIWFHKHTDVDVELQAQGRHSRESSPYRGALVGDKTGKYCQMLQPDEAGTRMFEGLCIHTARFWDPTNNLRTSYPQGGYLALPK